MTSKVDLTFSIVAYKNYKQIVNAINSINKFTSNYTKEIFVVDNTEEEAIKKFQVERDKVKRLDNVYFIQNNKNLGFGKANNIALSKSKGRYFVICNPDIILIEKSFDKIIPFIEENNSVGAVIPKLIDKNYNLQSVYRRELTPFDIFIRYFHPFNLFKKQRDHHEMKDMDYTKPFQVPFGQGSFLVVKTTLMRKLNGFDERYFMYVEDADLCKRINLISNLYYLPTTKVIHLWEKGSHKNIKLMKWHIQAMYKYFKKWNR